MKNEEQESGALSDWEALLNDTDAQRDLEAWHATLRERASQLYASGLVESLEYLELRELADAAYSHLIEESINANSAKR